jgi:myo-inositol 2-dehydrogenase / D-chiro-inositol 1-dehydrogenase
MGQTHLRALIDSSDVRVVALAEPVDSLRESAMTSFGVVGYSTLDDLLDGASLDGVLVVTPSDSHVDVITRVARAGLPVLCEKPCGVSPEDTARAREVVASSGVALQIAYWRRFVPELQVIRQRIDGGEFGEVLTVSCLQWDGEPPSSAFRARSGGIFVDMGVHEFDQVRWLTAGDIVESHAVASSAVTDPDSAGDPDAAQVLGRLSGGATALVSLGRHYASGDMASVEIFGTRDHSYTVFLDPRDGERAQLDALRRQASAFARFAAGGPCEGASVDDALAALSAARAASVQVSVGH